MTHSVAVIVDHCPQSPIVPWILAGSTRHKQDFASNIYSVIQRREPLRVANWTQNLISSIEAQYLPAYRMPSCIQAYVNN